MAHAEAGPLSFEAVIRRVWATVLKKGDVSSADHFFALGGDSITAVRATTMISRQLGIQLDPLELFRNPTPHALALRLEAHPARSDAPEADGAHADGAREAPSCGATPFQKRLFVWEKLRPEGEQFHQPRVFLARAGDPPALRSAFESVLRRHDILRTTFHSTGGKVTQRVRRLDELTGYFSFTRTSASTADLQASYEEIAKQPFSLEDGPLCRLAVVGRPAKAIAFLSLHHIISDGLWSENLIIEELLASLAGDASSPLARSSSMTHQFADYARWLEAWTEGQGGVEAREFWSKHFEGYRRVPFAGAAQSRARAGRVALAHRFSFGVGKDRTRRLEQLASEHRTTLFVVLQALLKALIHLETGSTDVVIGSAFSTRSGAFQSSTLGPLMNVLPLRDKVDADDSFLELLARTKATFVAVYPHRFLCVEELAQKREGGTRGPAAQLYDVGLTLQNQAEHVDAGADTLDEALELRPVNAGLHVALWFDVIERDGELLLRVDYAPNVFRESEVAALCARLTALADKVTDEPSAPIRASM